MVCVGGGLRRRRRRLRVGGCGGRTRLAVLLLRLWFCFFSLTGSGQREGCGGSCSLCLLWGCVLVRRCSSPPSTCRCRLRLDQIRCRCSVVTGNRQVRFSVRWPHLKLQSAQRCFVLKHDVEFHSYFFISSKRSQFSLSLSLSFSLSTSQRSQRDVEPPIDHLESLLLSHARLVDRQDTVPNGSRFPPE